MSVRVLATAELPAAALGLLAPVGAVTISRGELLDEVAGVEVLVVRGERVEEDVIAAASDLRVIARTGAGVDAVDIEAATRRGIPVVNAPVAGTGPVAEGTWALILAGAKRLGELRACIVEGRWPQRYAIEALDLHGSTLGVVGLGSIGLEVARLGHAFGMRIVGTDAKLLDDAAFGIPVEQTDLATLMRRSDVITLHCDLNDSTRGMIDRAALQLTERRPLLVNAARGPVVAGDDLLLEALDAGWLSAVALDVFATEPLPPESPLLRDPRVICTPHSVGLSRGWNENVFGSLARDIRAVLDGEEPRHLVNPDALRAGSVE